MRAGLPARTMIVSWLVTYGTAGPASVPSAISSLTFDRPAKYASGLTVHVMLPTVMVPPALICVTSRPGGIVSQKTLPRNSG